jgi:(p)ppGpp synthase/HD superfamily hydrolase
MGRKKQPLLGPLFEEALCFAGNLHAMQTRKGSGAPYISHLLSVTALVLQDGGDEVEAIAALLHDAVEDQGGKKTLEEIRIRFGDEVAEIVLECSDSITAPKPPWKERKIRYTERLKGASEKTLRISLADKLHNARSINRDIRSNGDEIWEKFNGGKQGTLWYYGELVKVFQSLCSGYMVDELVRVVTEIERLAGE